MHGLLYHTGLFPGTNEALDLVAEVTSPIFRETGETHYSLCEIPLAHHVCLDEQVMVQIWPAPSAKTI